MLPLLFSALSLHGPVTGIVVDAETGQPLADAVVTLTGSHEGDEVVVTDATGRYLFEDVPDGASRLIFEKEGYRVLEVSVFGKAVQPPAQLTVVPEDEIIPSRSIAAAEPKSG